MRHIIKCTNCDATLGASQRSFVCPVCSARGVGYLHESPNPVNPVAPGGRGIWRFASLLPEFAERVSLDEGNTPTQRAARLFEDEISLWLKIEGKNPTGSFLDRVSALMVSDAVSRGMRALVCASDGNLGASISAYAAASQIDTTCIVPRTTSPEKKAQIHAYGAKLVEHGRNVDEATRHAQNMAGRDVYQATPQFNILSLEGEKTIALELAENTHVTPEYLVVPVGSGGLLYSLWRGFQQARDFGLWPTTRLPKLIGVQLEEYDPITQAFETGSEEPTQFGASGPPTQQKRVADAILVNSPIFGREAIGAIRASGGSALSVSETEILRASKLLSTSEGVFAELSSATVIAAIDRLVGEGFFPPGAVVVAVITGTGLKTVQFIQETPPPNATLESFRTMGTKLDILHLIEAQTANSGTGIWKALGQALSRQAVYQHLKYLKQKEFIAEQESHDRHKRYRVTPKGTALLQKMRELETLLQ